ncbi:MAG: NUDIX domain-containing protein, partial [Thermoanaerobaculia bacterium]
MPDAAIGLNAVIVAVTEEVPRILTVRREPPGGGQAEDVLPFGPLEPETDRTLDRGLRRWVREQTGLELGYVEQLYTFGDRNRDPRESHGGPRLVSVAYLALVREVSVSGDARWRDWYEFFPWEDWRDGHPAILDRLAPALD